MLHTQSYMFLCTNTNNNLNLNKVLVSIGEYYWSIFSTVLPIWLRNHNSTDYLCLYILLFNCFLKNTPKIFTLAYCYFYEINAELYQQNVKLLRKPHTWVPQKSVCYKFCIFGLQYSSLGHGLKGIWNNPVNLLSFFKYFNIYICDANVQIMKNLFVIFIKIFNKI